MITIPLHIASHLTHNGLNVFLHLYIYNSCRYNVSEGLMGMYGSVGDFREIWPALPGKTVLRVRLTDLAPRTYGAVSSSVENSISAGVVGLVHCQYLKFEDRGLIGDFFVRSSALPVANTTINNSVNTTWINPNIMEYSVRATDAPAAEVSSASGLSVQVSLDFRGVTKRGYYSILVVSCFMWSGALDSSDVLQSYSTISVA